MGAYAAVAGLVLGGAGTIFSSQDARRTKNQLRDLANTPGLDIDTEIANALAGYDQTLPSASRIAGGVNKANATNLRDMLALGIPGYEGLQEQALGNISAELKGELPQDVIDLINRKTAGKALAGGYGGSQSARNLTTRDLGLTSLDMTQRGQDNYLKMIAGTPLPGLFGAQGLLGPTPMDRIGVRANERTQKLTMQMASIQSPGTDAIIGNWLQSTGGALMGAGVSGMSSGGAGASGGGAGSAGGSTVFDAAWG